MQKIRENAYKRSSALLQGVPSGMDLIGLLRVMQSDVNPHKTGRIVGCNIVYVMFLIICNSIINQIKKTILSSLFSFLFLFLSTILFHQLTILTL